MQLHPLENSEIEISRTIYGKNQLKKGKRKSFFRCFLSNLNDPIIKVLIVALIINTLVSLPRINYLESIGILTSVLIATLVSTISEYSSENAFEKLKNASQGDKVLVKRSGGVCEIHPSELVVGDIIILEAGCKIPADSIIIDGQIMVDESALTGESIEIEKKEQPSIVGELYSKILLALKSNKKQKLELGKSEAVFSGSTVTYGYCESLVTSVGENTYIGREAGELQGSARPSPLKNRLTQLAKFISRLGYIAAALVALVYLLNSFFISSHFEWAEVYSKVTDTQYLISHLVRALTLAVSITVVAVPEGLPMMITVVLSSNMKKMARDNVLIRKLVGIETSGNINLLFTDKTGTLTEGKLKVKEIYSADGEPLSISEIKKNKHLMEYLSLCAHYSTNATRQGGKVLGFDTTERALLEYTSFYKPKAELVLKTPFDSTKKYSAAIVKHNGSKLSLFKGAPEKIIAGADKYLDKNGNIVNMSSVKMRQILTKQVELSKKGLRVIAIGIKTQNCDTSLGKITFVCLVTLKDKIRKEVPSAINEVSQAGVGVVMITGDNKITAETIAKECGIISPLTKRHLVIEADTLHKMSDEEIKKALPALAVVARALPSDKNRLVKLSQEAGYIVGMTGDGVNDASSLKSADVGFSMGSGTEVAKEASDIVIKDNNFASIVKAVLYGRTIFESIRKFVLFQLIMNFSAVGISLLGPFIGVDTPVTITQMLWVNIIMDTLGALAFACEPPLKEYMLKSPKKPSEKILSSSMIKQIGITAIYILILCVWFLKSDTASMILQNGTEKYLLSAFFGLFIFVGVFLCFSVRTSRLNILSSLLLNKSFIFIMLGVMLVQISFIYFGGEALRTTPLSIRDLISVILISFSVIVFDTVRKLTIKLLRLSSRQRQKSNIERKRTNVK